jgi:hypothetical protein
MFEELPGVLEACPRALKSVVKFQEEINLVFTYLTVILISRSGYRSRINKKPVPGSATLHKTVTSSLTTLKTYRYRTHLQYPVLMIRNS